MKNSCSVDFWAVALSRLIGVVWLLLLSLTSCSGSCRQELQCESHQTEKHVMKKLFLCSSFADVADLLPELVGKERGTVTFIPTAALHEEYNLYVEEGRAALGRLGYTVEELEITQATAEVIEQTLERNDCIYVSGGNPFFLMQELRRKGADRAIVRRVKAGALYIGESAGSMIAAPNIAYAQVMDAVATAYTPNFRDFDALGLVDFYTVPHYGCEPFEESAEETVRIYSHLPLRPITNTQAICVEGDRTKIVSIDSTSVSGGE